ncbi:hypothetical protein [Actinoplanes derwentensis]|uniref:Uncharacterized protein n=1 Tax=Actinoplanes derwentensis TaxID=113562 RepID=A0A1H2C7A5_9ACTN|nr:hypothetical protein [Actinoplanes derwentensis]GID86554.1 hypothetical protein Ade03nite_54780 [Actinoplanes derwentensis]SDT66418.1 hypothetical protein SAMN04489716_5347 [Actinoplanes derwentensis]
MADETTLEPDGALRLFNTIGDLVGDLEAAVARVKTVRTTLSEPWGTDETGQNFAKSKEPSAIETLGYVDKAITFVRDLSTEGRGAVNEFVSLDRDNGGGLGPNS